MRVQKVTPEWFAYLDHPSIGSGWRVIGVRKAGWKWVHLRALGCGTNFKLLLKKWVKVDKRPLYQNQRGEWKADWKDKESGKRSNTKTTTKPHGKKPRKPRMAPKGYPKQKAQDQARQTS